MDLARATLFGTPLAALASRFPGALAPFLQSFANPSGGPAPTAALADAQPGTLDAKPPFGTPPFAPPHPVTGGAQPPLPTSAQLSSGVAGPVAAAGSVDPPRHGLSGFIDRLLNPSNSLGQFGQALIIGGGGPFGAAMSVMNQHHQDALSRQAELQKVAREQQRYDQERQDKLSERDWQHNKPEYFSGTADRLRLDPSTGNVTTVYDAPRPDEEYARSLGLDPDTAEGHRAMQDYVLRTAGPTALGGKTSLEDLRFAHRESLRGVPTYGQLHPLPGRLALPRATTPSTVVGGVLSKVANGQPLTGGEQQLYDTYRQGRGRRSLTTAPIADGATATGPNGKRIIMRGGQWVPFN